MTVEQQVTALAAELGAEVTAGRNSWGESDIDALVEPLVWRATDCHTLTAVGETRRAAWRSLLADMRKGVVPCTDADCEYPHAVAVGAVEA